MPRRPRLRQAKGHIYIWQTGFLPFHSLQSTRKMDGYQVQEPGPTKRRTEKGGNSPK